MSGLSLHALADRAMEAAQALTAHCALCFWRGLSRQEKVFTVQSQVNQNWTLHCVSGTVICNTPLFLSFSSIFSDVYTASHQSKTRAQARIVRFVKIMLDVLCQPVQVHRDPSGPDWFGWGWLCHVGGADSFWHHSSAYINCFRHKCRIPVWFRLDSVIFSWAGTGSGQKMQP